MPDLVKQIKELQARKNAVILCHTYQPGEIQDVADYVGDSYGLSETASRLNADLIIFCGVRFMAETAAILNPDRPVVMPDASAGCPMAEMITPEQLRQMKSAHPGAPVVCYVNSTAEVKAESTVCCTSSNAARIVASFKKDEEIIFVPDQYLGKFVERQLGRRLILWDGYCPTHMNIRPETIQRMRQQYPMAEVMVHPECTPEVQDAADHVLSTGQMIDLVRQSRCRQYLVGTEKGIIHALRKTAPETEFIGLSPLLVCPNMKKTTLAKVLRALDSGQPQVDVPPAIASRARHAIERMLELTRTG